MSRVCALVTHNDPLVTSEAVAKVLELANGEGVGIWASDDEIARHGLDPALLAAASAPEGPDVWLCLGGDGTILRGLRASTAWAAPSPAYGINFGEVGFLAATDPDDGFEESVIRALKGDFDVLDLPALTSSLSGGMPAFNDLALQRRPGLRVADIGYLVGGEEVGRVRCDGMVLSTPAGSTGYNLANGGPVVAWGVSGYVVSFIAPHSLTARALIVAPDDTVTLVNRSSREPVDVAVDGRPVGELEPGGQLEISYMHAAGRLAQVPGSSFYHRLRQKFGRLAS
ncbi:MAG: NAD(+)/NADH kinase [Solirubrobacterales bacterium]|nr:NAD(+)/NADH kinase [Solirubrobacterales bacterium]